MARPTAKPNISALDDLISRGKLEVHLKPTEDLADKNLRRRKEFWTFVIKDLLVHVLAILIIMLVVLYSFSVLMGTRSTPQEKEWAMSIVMAILTGIIGLLFGRATK